ncbi:MAG: saccharopine dehydrogenase C-terminal domain-containing protein [Thermoplasmatota archaeon]
MGSALVLGAGLVSRPLVGYLLDSGHEVTVASRTVEKAERVVGGHERGRSVRFDIAGDPGLEPLIDDHDITVSLLPYSHHVKVAKACIKMGKPMVTTSYVSDSMRSLDEEAKRAGVVILNEMGLDPGIDHMEAQRVIDEIKEKGGVVDGFISYCGGLPAPEANTNPWGYKFSWSPKGVVLASRNSARFKRDGNIVEIPGKDLFANYEMIDIEGLGRFEGYPNRDSVPYADIYGIGETRTILRGTLRNMGWCDTWKGLHDTGILDDVKPSGGTYLEMMSHLVPGSGDMKERLSRSISTRDNDTAMSNFEWLGLLSDRELLDRKSTVDALSSLLEEKLQYSDGERDMIVLQHTFHASMPDGPEVTKCTMIDYGIPGGDSAMSRTVGLPAAIGMDMILSGELDGLTGVHIPTHPMIYQPALEKLRGLGIEFLYTCSR